MSMITWPITSLCGGECKFSFLVVVTHRVIELLVYFFFFLSLLDFILLVLRDFAYFFFLPYGRPYLLLHVVFFMIIFIFILYFLFVNFRSLSGWFWFMFPFH